MKTLNRTNADALKEKLKVEDEPIDKPPYIPPSGELRSFLNKLKGRNYIVELANQPCELTHIKSDATVGGDDYTDMRLYYAVSIYPTGYSEARRCLSGKEVWRLFHEGIGGKTARIVNSDVLTEALKKQNAYIEREMKS